MGIPPLGGWAIGVAKVAEKTSQQWLGYQGYYEYYNRNVHNVNIAKGINEHFFMCGDRWRRGKDGWWAVVKEGVK